MTVRDRTSVIFVVIISSLSVANVNATVQRGWDGRVLVSGAYMRKLPVPRSYGEVGVDVVPGIRRKATELPGRVAQKAELNALYGAHIGYYYAVVPILRPGIHLGTSFRQKKILHSLDGGEYYTARYSDFKISPYFGLGIQFGVVSFIVSNEGIGGGLNIQLGGR